jgi:uncharacterized protein YjbI with pentapeptide repeats
LRCKLVEANFIDADLTECDFSGSELSGANFRNALLAKADLSTAQGAFLDPARNRLRGVRISLETAALLAASFGMRVAGFDDDEPGAAASGRRRRSR